MMTVIVDPMEGIAIPDGRVDGWVKHMINVHNNLGEVKIKIGTEVMLTRIRVAIKRGEVKDVEFFFNDKKIEHNSAGRLNHWPEGMADVHTDLLSEIL